LTFKSRNDFGSKNRSDGSDSVSRANVADGIVERVDKTAGTQLSPPWIITTAVEGWRWQSHGLGVSPSTCRCTGRSLCRPLVPTCSQHSPPIQRQHLLDFVLTATSLEEECSHKCLAVSIQHTFTAW